MIEPGWLTFYTAAAEIERRFGGSQAGAQAKLRQACADEMTRSMKPPYEEPNGHQLPFDLWTRVAPGESRERKVDYDGPDAHGCANIVMINEADFRHWLNRQGPMQPKAGVSSARPERDLAKKAIDALCSGIPPGDLLKARR
jgi:hypothetical protein